MDIVRAVDKLVAAFENALLDAEAVSYEVYLQTHCWYYYDKEEVNALIHTKFLTLEYLVTARGNRL